MLISMIENQWIKRKKTIATDSLIACSQKSVGSF